MNNKGFTIIEILTVIVLLAIVIIITVPVLGNVSDNVKKKTLNNKIENIESAAVLYAQEHRSDFTGNPCLICNISGCDCFNNTVTVGQLITEGKLKEDEIRDSNKVIVNPLDETKILNECKIQIYQKYGKIYAIYEKTESKKNTCWVE